MLVLGNESRDPHHMQGGHTRGAMYWFKEASGFEFEYSIEANNIVSFFIPMFSTRADMNIQFFILTA